MAMRTEISKTNRRYVGIASELYRRVRFRIKLNISRTLYKIRYRNFCPTFDGNSVVCGLDEYIASTACLLERGSVDKFLRRLMELTTKLLSETLRGRALFIPELDELTRKACLVVRSRTEIPPNAKLLVHVATELMPTGGHTRVIEDIAAALPEYKHILIVTSMHNSDSRWAFLAPRFEELRLEVRLLQTVSYAEKARELSSVIAALGPGAVLLLAHQYDSIAYVGVPADAAPRVLFLHHTDHHPSLGASRVDYLHVDLTPGCHRICASRPLLQASLLNLTAKDVGTVQLVDRQSIIGVTCGSSHKYLGSSEYSYGYLLAALFSAGVNRVLHIGDMDAWQKDQIRADIFERGQDAGRVLFLPDTPSLAAKLIEISPDFYLTSHPLGGGKANVEAMSVGLPILYVCPASTPPLLNPDMTFATSVPVSTLEQIPDAVRRLETDKKLLASRSRATYEKHYSAAAFREQLLSLISIDGSDYGNVRKSRERLVQI
jgi:glycosyltransferase involved in cell wall biosynthesis